MFSEKIDQNMVKQRKDFIEKVLSCIVTVSDLSDVRQSELLEECGVTVEHYENALGCMGKKVSILHKRKPF